MDFRRPTSEDAHRFGYKSVAEMEHKLRWYGKLFGVGQKLCSGYNDDRALSYAFTDTDGNVLVAN